MNQRETGYTSGASLKASYDRFFELRNRAIDLDRFWREGQEAAGKEAVSHLPRRATASQRKFAQMAGRIKWAQDAIARDMRDDMLLAQRMATMSYQQATMELLLNMTRQLDGIASRLDILITRSWKGDTP